MKNKIFHKIFQSKSETLLVPLKPPSCKACNIFQSMGGYRKKCRRFEDKENNVAWIVFETTDKNGNVEKQTIQDF